MSELIKNNIYKTEITDYTHDGLGICRIEGCTVFVPGVIVGEECLVKVIKVGKSVSYGRCEQVLSPSAERINPDCSAFPACGGCVCRNMSYAEELRFKLIKVSDMLKKIGNLDVAPEEIIPADSVDGYRNKAIFQAGTDSDGKIYFGFYRRHSHQVIKSEGCKLVSPLSLRVCRLCEEYFNSRKITAFDETSGKGIIRHIFLRTGSGGKYNVLCVVAAKGLGSNTEGFVKFIVENCPEITGIVININKDKTNVVLSDKFYTLYGSPEIIEEIGNVKYSVSPAAFFQVNTIQTEKLYQTVRTFATGKEKTKALLDLYCGAGTISQFLADSVEKIVGVDLNSDAIENAKQNARLNNIDCAEYICSDASKYMAEQKGKFDCVVVDPPRKGLTEGGILDICNMSPERVVYVSCDPGTLSRDLKLFCELGYEVKRVKCVDMFPRTEHVETVVLMSKVQN